MSDFAQALCDSSAHMGLEWNGAAGPCRHHVERAKAFVAQLARNLDIKRERIAEVYAKRL